MFLSIQQCCCEDKLGVDNGFGDASPWSKNHLGSFEELPAYVVNVVLARRVPPCRSELPLHSNDLLAIWATEEASGVDQARTGLAC